MVQKIEEKNMITNTSDKTRQISILLKIAAGLFVLAAILDSVDYFNYTSFALSLFDFIANVIALIFLAVVMFSMKGLAVQENNQGSSKFTLAGVGLIVYPIVWSAYYFDFLDGFLIIIFLLFVKGIAFSLIYAAFKTLHRKMESWIYPLYGFTQLIFFGILFFLYFMWLDGIADVVVTISYWLDTLLIVGVAIVLFLGSNKITSAPKAVPSVAQPYAPGTIYTPNQPPVQPPTQPI
ncbi:MAG: hypothetical protein KAQ70_06595, partial [Candidatus Heimdallarchaeota archaeon]|nr:hypothetical protein [Candidatus Heimdallarchaeota archaeon]